MQCSSQFRVSTQRELALPSQSECSRLDVPERTREVRLPDVAGTDGTSSNEETERHQASATDCCVVPRRNANRQSLVRG